MIYSRKGVYAGHYWEDIGFNLNKELQGDLYANKEEAFQVSVLDALRDGVTDDEGAKEHQSLSEVAERITDKHIRAFLIIPETGEAEVGIGPEDPYRDEWDRMKESITEIIPALADEDKWTEHQYSPVQREEVRWGTDPKTQEPKIEHDPLEEEARGKVLVKYDGWHRGRKKAMIWVERELIWSDDWI